jgi:predicted O-methyltransferase YrrM
MSVAAAPRPPRATSARARDLGREIFGSPLPRSVIGGGGVFIVGFVDGMNKGAAVALGAATGVLLYAVLYVMVQMGRQARNTEDTHVLASLLGPHTPPLGTWAIEADFGGLIYQEMQSRPQVVVECGSGVTTLLIAACLRAQGSGRLYSLEHDAHFAVVTRERLEAAGLSEWVELIVAPLTEQCFDGRRGTWYDEIEASKVPGGIDLLIVDGPPDVRAWARWPALEVFHDRLNPGATLLLDDGRRRHERRVASRWAADHREYQLFWHDTVKGTWKLTKREGPRAEGAATAAARALVRTLNPMPSAFGRWPVSR